MAPTRDADEPELDLYGLPLERFTPARDELARRLRKEGERTAADQVKALRKPSVVAWALNQVRRHDRERVEELLAAGERLRDAQQRLLAGGEHGLLRDAVTEERRVLEVVAGLAKEELAKAGHAANASLENRLWQTLQAAARDDQTRALLDVGRLIRDSPVGDFGLGAMGGGFGEASAAAAEASMRTPKGARASRWGAPAPEAASQPAGSRRNAARERKITAAQNRVDRARLRQRELEEKHGELQDQAADARRDAERAVAAAERAEEHAEQALVKARDAAARTQELDVALAELESEA